MNKAVLLQSAWTDQIRSRLEPAYDLIAAHWHASCDSTVAYDFSSLASLKPLNDLDTAIPNLDRYLSQIALRTSTASTSDFTPTSVYPAFSSKELPIIVADTSEQTFFRLAAMEKWTEEHLESWIEQRYQDATVCEQLRSLVASYYAVASVQYTHLPLKLSIM